MNQQALQCRSLWRISYHEEILVLDFSESINKPRTIQNEILTRGSQFPRQFQWATCKWLWNRLTTGSENTVNSLLKTRTNVKKRNKATICSWAANFGAENSQETFLSTSWRVFWHSGGHCGNTGLSWKFSIFQSMEKLPIRTTRPNCFNFPSTLDFKNGFEDWNLSLGRW